MKSRGKPGAQEVHHYLPQNEKMKTWFGKAGLNVEKFKGGLEKAVHRRLHKGKGFGRGGIWNGMWNMYMKGKDPTKVDPNDVKGFANTMSRFLGVD